MGWCEPSPRPTDATQISGELHVLLQEISVGDPYVLVGHSLGGLYSRGTGRRLETVDPSAMNGGPLDSTNAQRDD